MTFEELNEDKLTNDDYLWRYLSIHKFVAFITKKTLLFSRLDLFQDPFEGVTTRLIKERFLAKLTPDKERLNPKIPLADREQMIKAKEAVERRYNKEAMLKQKTQYVNCWFKGSRESMTMWNIYSNNTGVAIKIEGRKLINYLNNIIDLQPLLYPNHKFICGNVKYFRLNPVDMFEKVTGVKYSALKKDKSYEYENEYRFLIVTPRSELEKNPFVIELNITNTFFENTEVICHPEMPEWQFENITNLCKDVKFNKISKSKIELK